MANLWKEFVRDQRACRMSWGGIMSYEVFIDELHLARESEHQIAWKLKISIDKSDDQPSIFVVRAPDVDLFAFNEAMKMFGLTAIYPQKMRSTMTPDFMDQLDALAGALNGPSAALNRLVGQIGDLERATFSTLQHFRAAISGFEIAVINLQNAAMSTTIDSAVLVRSAEADIAWITFQLSIDDQTTGILGVLSQADKRAALASRSAPSKLITAKSGDSWESLSVRATGGFEKAADIRAANGARYGERPVVGETYVVF